MYCNRVRGSTSILEEIIGDCEVHTSHNIQGTLEILDNGGCKDHVTIISSTINPQHYRTKTVHLRQYCRGQVSISPLFIEWHCENPIIRVIGLFVQNLLIVLGEVWSINPCPNFWTWLLLAKSC